MLAEKVAAGDLPPLAERLPEVPFVVQPGVLLPEDDIDWEVGQYGGTLRTARNNVNWNPDVFVMNNEPLVMGPGITGEDIIPGVVQDFDVNEEFSEFTFYLRKGLKWSDGTPVTTDDVRFAYEDVLLNEKLTPAFPAWLRSGNSSTGEPMTLGLDERDPEGYRLGPDGETFTIPFELSSRTPEMVPTAEIVSEFLRDVGLDTSIKTIDSQLRGQRRDANELRATIERSNQPMTWQHHRGWYQPIEWAPLWNLWNTTGGRDGEEPPAVVKEFLDLTGRAITALPEDRVEIREQYQQIQYDNMFFITPVEKERRPIIAKDKLRNVAHDGFSIASCFAGEQFFFAE